MIPSITVGKNLLETITSALYEDPIILFREYVQNSVDAYKRAIKEEKKGVIEQFHVSIETNPTSKQIIIKDNGYGIETEEDFYNKMTSFAMSDKSDRTQYIGFRGIGRISAMPFCTKLTFINKAKGTVSINECSWDGSQYKELLNSDVGDFNSFETIVKAIVDVTTYDSNDDLDSHYFKVIIEGYGPEIEEVISKSDFKQRLRKMLPLRYSPEFSLSTKIISRYNEFMVDDFSEYAYAVKLNKEDLYKNYKDSKHVLESDIMFWEIRRKPGPNNRVGEKIGIIWFTFNRKFDTKKSKNDTDYGILIRSKNVLMGGNDTFADLCAGSNTHVATHRELTQTLRGVYGELLINDYKLRDNARREWFRTDDHSIYLKSVILSFMDCLYKYRYRASNFYSEKTGDNKSKLKEALVNLADPELNNLDINSFYESETSKDGSDNSDGKEEQDSFIYAEEDIPRHSKTRKKTYEELMKVIDDFFQKENRLDIFLKLRAYIKNHFND